LTLVETGNPTLMLQAPGILLKNWSFTPKEPPAAFKHLQIAFFSSTVLSLGKLLQPSAASRSWLRRFSSGKPYTGSCLFINSAAWNSCLVHVGKEKEEGEEEDHIKESVLHGFLVFKVTPNKLLDVANAATSVGWWTMFFMGIYREKYCLWELGFCQSLSFPMNSDYVAG